MIEPEWGRLWESLTFAAKSDRSVGPLGTQDLQLVSGEGSLARPSPLTCVV